MENSNSKVKLYKKLLTIQERVKGLGKDSKSFGYSYTSGSKVLGEIKPIMNELGLLLKQEVTGIRNERQDYTVKTGTKSEILTTIDMLFTWVDTDTGETDVNQFAANGQNDWEKGFGSALTYAERYFLLKYFHIPTDEDDIDNPDRKKASTTTSASKPTTPPPATKAPAPKKETKAPAKPKGGIETPSAEFAEDQDKERRAKALQVYSKLDKAEVLKHLIKVEKLKYTSIEEFIEKEKVDKILEIYQKLK